MSSSGNNWVFGTGVTLSVIGAIFCVYKLRDSESITDITYKGKKKDFLILFLFIFLILAIGYIIINLAAIRPDTKSEAFHTAIDCFYLSVVIILGAVFGFSFYKLNPCPKIESTGFGTTLTSSNV